MGRGCAALLASDVARDDRAMADLAEIGAEVRELRCNALSIAFASTQALALSITRSRQNWAVYLDVHTVRFGVRIAYCLPTCSLRERASSAEPRAHASARDGLLDGGAQLVRGGQLGLQLCAAPLLRVCVRVRVRDSGSGLGLGLGLGWVRVRVRVRVR
eukprot:scaffold112635_cov90-Phaeocystis_antarctica.AAC.1